MSTDTRELDVEPLDPATGLTAYVAGRIRAYLGWHSISKSELARRLGVDDTWVGKRLNGRTEITLADLDRIATACHVAPTIFLPRSITARYSSAHVIATGSTPRRPRARYRVHRPGRAVAQTRPLIDTPVTIPTVTM